MSSAQEPAGWGDTLRIPEGFGDPESPTAGFQCLDCGELIVAVAPLASLEELQEMHDQLALTHRRGHAPGTASADFDAVESASEGLMGDE